MIFHMLAFYCADLKSICITVMVPIVSYEVMMMLHHDQDINVMGWKICLSYAFVLATFVLVSIAIMLPGQLIV